MNQHSRLATIALTFAFFGSFTPTPAQVSVPTNATVYASGLNGPRGMAFGPDGALYVAETGAGTNSTVGACTQVAPPIGPYHGGTAARISKVLNGEPTRVVASGFPSAVAAQGDTFGVADLTFLNGNLYALIAGGGCSHGNPNLPNGVAKVNLKTGEWHYIADLSTLLAEHPPAYNTYDDFEPDGVPYSMVAENGSLFVVEPNHAQILKVETSGTIKLAYDFSFAFGDVTPTSLVFRQTNAYIGNLDIFPIRVGTARVTTLTHDAFFTDTAPGLETDPYDAAKFHVAGSRAGFTTIVGERFGPDGLLYVLEISAAAGYPQLGTGKVVRLNQKGVIEDVVTGLTLPTAIAFGPDNALYISNAGDLPAGSGQILRVATY